jgi:ribosomal protein S27E
MIRCKWCRHPLVCTSGVSPLVLCLRCDSAPCTAPGSKLRVGPPRMLGTKVGWFVAPEDWQT